MKRELRCEKENERIRTEREESVKCERRTNESVSVREENVGMRKGERTNP